LRDAEVVVIAVPTIGVRTTMFPVQGNRACRPALGRDHGGGQIMDFTRGALLWLLGVPLPIILLIALFWHH
jgi:hypothetical protein